MLAILERYKATGGNLFALIKICLCEHFGLTEEEADALFVEYHIRQSEEPQPNTELDCYFENVSVKDSEAQTSLNT